MKKIICWLFIFILHGNTIFSLDILPGFTKTMPTRFFTVMFENEPSVREDQYRRYFLFELNEGEYGFQEGKIELTQSKRTEEFLGYSLFLPPTYENLSWALNKTLERKLRFHTVSDILTGERMFLSFQVSNAEVFYYLVIEAQDDRVIYSVQFQSPYM